MALTWMIFRGFSTPATTAALAAVGLASGLLLVWTNHRHDTCTKTKIEVGRVRRQVANMIGELSALRNEDDDRWAMQRMWATDREMADLVFGPHGNPGGHELN